MFDLMLGDVVSARTNDDNNKILKLRLSSPNFAKPPVVRHFYYADFIFVSCRIDVKCPNKTIGTIKVGNQLNGKFRIAMFGWSNAKICKGDGAENIALITMFNKRARQIKFQTKINFLLNFPFVKPKYAINGAVIPAIMSKLRPSKVISCGIALLK